ncbi:MAG: AAA family ATPase [Deltaproteobacteria bacterium]|nr:AAA family ATPase [Deltaproteobacteria bacterium]
MYTAHFGLKENPFSLSPDPRYLFLSPQHREALNCLIYGINEKKGFMVITGEIGTGKTTVCRTLLSGLDASVETALIFNSAITDMELLAMVNEELGVKAGPGRRTKKRCIDALNKYLLRRFSENKNVVLLIDEAQNLSHSTMEQIRMLSNLETVQEKLLQIILIGQSELREMLKSPSLKQLNERITVRYHIRALTEKSLGDYIRHRLTVAGGEGRIEFTWGALKLIYHYSQGNPRRINAICDRALLIAYAKTRFKVDAWIVRASVKDIGASYFAGRKLGWRN